MRTDGFPAGERARERRRARRFAVQDVRGSILLTTSATIVNMSLTGMAVASSTNLRIGRSYAVTLAHGGRQGPALTGTVVWCHLKAAPHGHSGDTSPVYEAGIQFAGMLSEKADELVAFLRTTAILTMQERLTGRFQVAPGESVALGAECEFVVRTLSASGMLIETDTSPAPGASYELRVVLDGARIRPRVRVAYLRDVGEQNKRRITAAGVEFVSMPAADRAALDAFIARQIASSGA
jgi:hypothetical protein